MVVFQKLFCSEVRCEHPGQKVRSSDAVLMVQKVSNKDLEAYWEKDKIRCSCDILCLELNRFL